MCRFESVKMNSGRKSEISSEEIDDEEIDNESDFFYPEDDWGEGCCEDDYEPEEREYCD